MMRLITCLGISLISITALAAPKDELKARLRNFHSVEADFFQTVQDEWGESIAQHSGKLWIQRPDQFAWRQAYPDGLWLIADGRWFYELDDVLDQVTIRLQHEAIQNTPAAWLSQSNLDWLDAFQVVPREKPKGWSSDCYQLIPEENTGSLTFLNLCFDGEALSQIEFADALGQVTTVVFSAVQWNQPIEAETFLFEIPEDVDIVDMTS